LSRWSTEQCEQFLCNYDSCYLMEYNVWVYIFNIYFFEGVVFLSILANHRRVVKLDYVDQFVLSYGGLRGAIAFALVVLLHEDYVPERRKFITTAIFIIYFTNLIQVQAFCLIIKTVNVLLECLSSRLFS